MSEGRSRIHEHDEELTDEETRDVELGGNSANDHHHNRLHYYERDEVSRVNHERGKQFKTLAGRLAWVVICFTIFILLLLIILYSIRSAYLFSYDESYTSSIEKTPSLNVQVYTTGRRDRVLFNYLTKVDDSRKKPTKGNMYLEMDDNGNTKPTLLFVNPFPESCEGAFLPAITELKADFTIHCINLRGFGTTESTNANDDNYLTLAAMANELAVIVETKKPQDELILIGQEFSGTIIYLLLHQKGKTWVDNYLKAVILLNSPHPKIYSSLLIANERQKFFTQKVMTAKTVGDWTSLYYSNSSTEQIKKVETEWGANNHFEIIRKYISVNFLGSVDRGVTYAFPTDISTDYDFTDLLVIFSNNHPLMVYPENVIGLEDVKTKEVKGGVWFARDHPQEFSEIVRNFVFSLIHDKSDDKVSNSPTL